jgi:uncharacterized protein (TIGR02246 family)
VRPLIGFLCIVGAACSPTEQKNRALDTSADVRSIRDIYAIFAAADLSGDVERQLSVLSDDAVFMPPGVPTVSGKPALRERWSKRHSEEVLKSFDVDPGEIVVVGDLAYSRGTSVARGMSNGKPFVDSVRHLDILRRQPDGRWLIARHLRNSP